MKASLFEKCPHDARMTKIRTVSRALAADCQELTARSSLALQWLLILEKDLKRFGIFIQYRP